MSSLPTPRYTIWQAVSAALAVGQRAMEEVRALSREPGPQGERGERGVDGLGFDDLSVEFDGERTAKLKFARGDQVKTFDLKFPIILDRGVWKEGSYEKGDGVTWGGSFFIATRDTTSKPETPQAKDDWRLAVKRGQNGAAGTNGARGPQGMKGERGESGPRGYGG